MSYVIACPLRDLLPFRAYGAWRPYHLLDCLCIGFCYWYQMCVLCASFCDCVPVRVRVLVRICYQRFHCCLLLIITNGRIGLLVHAQQQSPELTLLNAAAYRVVICFPTPFFALTCRSSHFDRWGC